MRFTLGLLLNMAGGSGWSLGTAGVLRRLPAADRVPGGLSAHHYQGYWLMLISCLCKLISLGKAWMSGMGLLSVPRRLATAGTWARGEAEHSTRPSALQHGCIKTSWVLWHCFHLSYVSSLLKLYLDKYMKSQQMAKSETFSPTL